MTWSVRWRTLLTLTAVLPPAAASAQTTVRIGPVAGVSSSDVRTGNLTESIDIDRRTGFVAGVFVTVGVSPRFAIQPELLYSQQGARVPVEAGIAGVIKLDYVQVPVLAQLRFPGGGNAVPFLIAGPSLGFKASCELAVEAFGTSLDVDCDDPVADLNPFTSTDLSGVLGVGVEVSGLTVSARYQHGFTNINDLVGEVETIRNRVLSLMVGYGFRLSR
jgi:hypothetical protein